MRIPVMVLAHARVEFTRRVLAATHAADPAALLFVVDGARPDKNELEEVMAVRAVVEEFAWNCSVTTIFSDVNLGVRRAMLQGLDKFFSDNDSGVILEDDCLPSPSFFAFAAAALEKYADVSAVGMIAGTNMLGSSNTRGNTAFFSEGHIWGWATWADRWREYRSSNLTLNDAKEAPSYYGLGWPYRRRLLKRYELGILDSWAIPWLFFLAETNQYGLVPPRNLVENVGHAASGTHTSGTSRYSNLKTVNGGARIVLPDSVIPNRKYQFRYALGLQWESAVHRARRPFVRLVRDFTKNLRRRRGQL